MSDTHAPETAAPTGTDITHPLPPPVPDATTPSVTPQKRRNIVPTVIAGMFAVAAIALGVLYVTTKNDLDSTKKDLAATTGELTKLQDAEAARQAEADARPDIFKVVKDAIGSSGGLGVLVNGDATYASITIPDYAVSAMPGLEKALEDLGFPSSIGSRIGNTRALDGTLTAQAPHIQASWTYHPDDGLNMVIERTD